MYDRESLLNIEAEDDISVSTGSNKKDKNDSIRIANLKLAESEKDEILREIFKEFAVFCNIPHASGNESELRDIMAARMESSGFRSYIDDAGNLICDIPASIGLESVPLTVLQGHLDMVCASKEGSSYIPETDPIAMCIDLGSGTGRSNLCTYGDSSLGADCGIGCAVISWLTLGAGSDFEHGPLRLIFTVEEEIGLVGASKIDRSALSDVRYLINVDGFAERHVVAGSAGGRRETFYHISETETPVFEDPSKWCAFEFTLTGFKGGHSGYDIDKGRVNAVKLIADLLTDMEENGTDFVLASFNGGLQHNIIPSSASAVVVFKREELMNCQRSIQMLMYELSMRYGESDWGGRFVYHEIALPQRVFTKQCTHETIDFVHGLCDGVYAYTDIEKDEKGSLVVDTSINIGRISCTASDTRKEKIEVSIFLRLLSDTFGDILLRMNSESAEANSFESYYEDYPVWNFNNGSELLIKACSAYEETTGKKALATAVHVGLEPSAFLEKSSSIEAISIGAEIHDAHSINERVEIDSIKNFALTLKTLLVSIGKEIK